MAYAEGLAARVQDAIGDRPGLAEKQMVGGLAFLAHGNMACGVRGDDLIVRLAADAVESVQGVQPVRAVRRAWSRRLRPAPVEAVADVAMALVGRQRWVAYDPG